MDLQKGVVRLAHYISARKALEKKLETNPGNEVIIKALEAHKKSEEFLKNALNFNDIFDVKPEIIEKIVEVPAKTKKKTKTRSK